MTMTRDNIDKIWVTDSAVCLRTTDGREACEYFDNYPRLKCATKGQRENFELDHFGIHWAELDEDLSYEGFFIKPSHNRLYSIFMAHPELNASAIARRLGMSQSLFAQYISGTKKPSKDREAVIIREIQTVGSELLHACECV